MKRRHPAAAGLASLCLMACTDGVVPDSHSSTAQGFVELAIELQTLLGQVVKTLTLTERDAISRFAGNVHTRHDAVTPDR